MGEDEKEEELRVRTPRHLKRKYQKISIIIAACLPLLLILYILYMSWMPFGYSKTYTLQLGAAGDNDSGNDIYISKWQGSPQIRYGEELYRELKGEAEIIFKPQIDLGKVKAYVRIDFEGDNTLYIKNNGAWEVYWNPAWDKYYELYEFNITEEDIKYLNEPINLKKGDSVKVLVNPEYVEEAIAIDVGYIEGSETTINKDMIRGKSEFFVYLKDELNMTLWKEDMNFIEGKDEFNITLYNRDGKVIYSKLFLDDDNGTLDLQSKDTEQEQNFYKANIFGGTYLLVIQNMFSNFSDSNIIKLVINTNKIDIFGPLQQQSAQDLMRASYPYKDKLETHFWEGAKYIPAGMLNSNNNQNFSDWMSRNRNDNIYFHRITLKNFSSDNQQYNGIITTINTALRGSHSFYVYLNDSLNVTISKKDMNWYEGKDDLNITLFALDGVVVYNALFEDDDDGSKGAADPAQQKNFYATGLKKDTYILDLRAIFGNNAYEDFNMESISVNTDKIVTFNHLLPTSPLELYTENYKSEDIILYYWQKGYEQNVLVKGDENKILRLSEEDAGKAMTFEITGKNSLIFPKGNLHIYGDMIFAFNKDNYFMPLNYGLEAYQKYVVFKTNDPFEIKETEIQMKSKNAKVFLMGVLKIKR